MQGVDGEIQRGDGNPDRVLQIHGDLHDRSSHLIEPLESIIRDFNGGDRSPDWVQRIRSGLHYEGVGGFRRGHDRDPCGGWAIGE